MFLGFLLDMSYDLLTACDLFPAGPGAEWKGDFPSLGALSNMSDTHSVGEFLLDDTSL